MLLRLSPRSAHLFLFSTRLTHSHPHLVIAEPVRQALHDGRGVVALESTVITHGLPHPNNYETGASLESIIRAEGAEPATIALFDGKVHVGLSSAQLARIAEEKEAVKVSRRDIARTLVQNRVGGTTVAATMLLAHQAGIRVFSTGGIGGVHRGVGERLDISADLQELARTPVTVVCAGVKSILDIQNTVEYMETQSINSIVFSSSSVFPGFFSPSSPAKGQFNTQDIEEVVRVMDQSLSLGLPAGCVLACPIPEEHQADGAVIEQAIQQALKEASEQGVCGQQITPFLLARVNQLTKGASMKTNIALLQNNARIGARLANEFAKQARRVPITSSAPSSPTSSGGDKNKPRVTAIGATIVDFEAITDEDVKDDGGSYVGVVAQRCGGVGRNHADALARLGCHSTLLSAVGADSHAEFFRSRCQHIDLSRLSTISSLPTATYMSMNVKGNVRYGISSIGQIVEHITPKMLSSNESALASSAYILIDGNVPAETLKRATEMGQYHGVSVWFEPTDIAKMQRLFEAGVEHKVSAISPNANEFAAMCKCMGVEIDPSLLSSPSSLRDWLSVHPEMMLGLDVLVVSLSTHGTVIVRRTSSGLESTVLRPPIEPERVVSVSGAGDSFNSGLLAGIVHGMEWETCTRLAQSCAAATLQTTEAVSAKIGLALIGK